jgi:hypothetical protein
MATYNSGVYLNGTRLRPGDQCECAETTISYTFPEGVAVASGDVVKFARIGENVKILSVELNWPAFGASLATGLDVGGDGTTLAVDAFIDGAATSTAIATAGVVAKIAGLESADTFADGNVPASAVVEDLQMTVAGAVTTAITNTDRTFTLRVKYQYAYPDQYITGVSDETYPFAGEIEYAPAEVETYNGNAP